MKITIAAFFLLALISLVVFVNAKSGHLGKIQPTLVEGELAFTIDYGHTNGLLGLTITDVAKNEIVWDINLAYYHGATLKYGEVPQDFKTFNGVTNSAKQAFPARGIPAALVEGRVYKLYSDWQYDTFVTAAARNQELYFKIDGKKINQVDRPDQ